MYPAGPLFIPIPGAVEMGVILLLAVLLFGAQKIPKLARATGESIGEFKKGREEIEQEINAQEAESGNQNTSNQSSVEYEADTEPTTASAESSNQ